jgi:SAM-dependent methyltransferase
MTYQDIWVNGKLETKGVRSCADRYEIIKANCAEVKTVLDIGANMCYFGIRLIEDFNCSVMAFEFHQFEMRQEIVSRNKTKNLIFLKRKLSLPDLQHMANYMHFDLVLAMSVIHHLPGDTSQWIQAFRNLGDKVIMEFAFEDSKRPDIRKNYAMPTDAEIIGYGDSHLKKDFKRPIILLK